MRSPGLRISTGDDTDPMSSLSSFSSFLKTWWQLETQNILHPPETNHLSMSHKWNGCPTNHNRYGTSKPKRSLIVVTPLRTLVREINSKMTISHYMILDHLEPFTTTFSLHIMLGFVIENAAKKLKI